MTTRPITTSGATRGADPDWRVRLAAFEALRQAVVHHGPVLSWEIIAKGFVVEGKPCLFASKGPGIFRPAGMKGGALSIKTTVPRRGRGAPKYDDLAGNDVFSYALQARGEDYRDNRYLLQCEQLAAPFIYFFGIEPGHYRPIWPVYIQEVRLAETRVLIAAASDHAPPVQPGLAAADSYGQKIERRYATVEVKRRLHQDAFRYFVLDAYSERCAICNLPRRELLDAAHILPDRDPLGEPSVPNGLSLCKLHHSAFDANLIGISPDRVVEVSRILLDETDGPTLEVALKGFAGRTLQLPRHTAQHPNRDFLDARYQQFRAA